MKKLISILIVVLLVVGCATTRDSAAAAVKEYLAKYNNNDPEVLTELENLIKEEGLDEEQGDTYKEVMKKQYDDLKYEIEEEKYNGDTATVTTKITVYDLYSTQKEADEYKNNHREEFMKDGKYDANLFLDYKLKQMKKNTKKVEYKINFQVVKRSDKWTVENVSTEDLEKIHGIYEYANQ